MDLCILAFLSSVRNRDYNKAIAQELSFYNTFVKASENLTHWFYWLATTQDTKRELDENFAQARGAQPTEFSPKTGRYDICIVFHNFSGLAHEQVMSRVVERLVIEGVNLKVLVVYIFGGKSSLISARRVWAPSQVHFAFLEAQSYTEGFKRLGMLLRHHQADSVVYPSIYFLAYWGSNFLAHHNQKFVTMKYPPPQLGNLRIFGGGLPPPPYFETVDYWVMLHAAPFPVRKRARIHEDGFVRFGSISRVEKQLAPGYSEFILDILEDNPNLRYLHTGRESDLPLFPEWMKKHPRVDFLGWVEPADSIDFFDIYLETFPWGGGDMSYLAISRKIPYLALETFESKFLGVVSYIQQKFTSDCPMGSGISSNLNELKGMLLTLSTSECVRLEFGARQFEVVFGGRVNERDFVNVWRSFLLS